MGIVYMVQISIIKNGNEYPTGDPLIFNQLRGAWRYLQSIYDSYFAKDAPEFIDVKRFVGVEHDEFRIGQDKDNCILYKIHQAIYTDMN